MAARICRSWGVDACRIGHVRLERLRDFFRVTGEVTNLLDCTLPHLQLKVTILNKKGRQVDSDVFHVTDRKLEPGESARFKIEREWKRGMSNVKVTVWPCARSQE